LSYDESDGLPSRAACFGMSESADGSLWFAFWGAGVYRMGRDGSVRSWGAEQGLHDLRVWGVEAAGAGAWVFTEVGLGRVDGDRFRWVPLPPGMPSDLGGGRLTSEGSLLVFSFDDGLFELAQGRARPIGAPVGSDVVSLTGARDGSVWCCGEGWGAVRLRHGKPDLHLTTANGLPSNHVNSVFEDSSGAVWVATDRGVWRGDRNGCGATVEELGELASSFVYWVTEHPDRVHWFGTNSGLYRLPHGGSLERYSVKDGLGSNECNDGGFLVDSEGRFLVSTAGLSRWVGRRPAPAVDPPVYVETVRAAGRTLRHPLRVEVMARSGPVTFCFESPSFIDETATRFRYRLLGLSEAWALTSAEESSTTYGGLPPGEYRLEVEALTGDGRSSARPAVVSLIVTPLWWQRSATHVGGLVALGLLACAGLRWRERRFARQQRRMESLVRDRTEELRQASRRFAELAATDELTGLANRRSIMEWLRQMAAFATRSGDVLVAAMIDVDHFKEVNDRLGHEAGDRVLQAVAAALRSALRDQDRLGRYGGDEFLAIFPGTDARQALLPCQRMRAALGSSLGDLPPPAGRVTLSIGLSGFAVDDSSVEAMIRRADQALYEAKAAGRNTVRVAPAGPHSAAPTGIRAEVEATLGLDRRDRSPGRRAPLSQ
jgi:diguanylate cyclase (GGDEF)-like protein